MKLYVSIAIVSIHVITSGIQAADESARER